MRIRTISSHIYPTTANRGVTSTGSGTGVDTTGYSSALVGVLANSASAGSITISVDASPDNSAWTPLGTFTIGTSKTNNWFLADVNLKYPDRKYIRCSYTISGAGHTLDFNYFLGNGIGYPVTQVNTVKYY